MENITPVPDSNRNKNDSIFSADEFSMAGYDKHIRQARNAIFVAAGVLVLNIIVLAYNSPAEYEYLWLDFIIWGAFIVALVAMALWTKRKPYYAIIGALIIYGAFILLNALLDITTIYKGIIMKVVIIVLLVKGLNDAKSAQEMKILMGNNSAES